MNSGDRGVNQIRPKNCINARSVVRVIHVAWPYKDTFFQIISLLFENIWSNSWFITWPTSQPKKRIGQSLIAEWWKAYENSRFLPGTERTRKGKYIGVNDAGA